MIPKFRAWDKEDESWIDIKSLGMMDGEITTLEEWDDDLPYFIEDLGKTWELMQSTGLHDVNGKEIFEGDIVKARWWNIHGDHERVTLVEWDVNKLGWNLINKSSTNMNYEIIGNIHEHPELLIQPNE